MARPTGSDAGAPLRAGEPRVRDVGPRLEVLVELANGSDRAVWAVADVRGTRYDEAARTLRVLLTDRGLASPHLVGIAMLPRFVEVAPGGRATLRVEVPKTLTRMRPPAGPPQPVPELERLQTTEAETVEVVIGWSRAPFDRRAGGDLAAWEEGVVETRGPLRASGRR